MEHEELNLVRSRIVNRIAIISAVFFLPAYILSLLRWMETGWLNLFIIHTVVYTSFVVTALLRKKFTVNFKIIFLAVLYVIVSISGLWYFGFSGSHYFLIMSVALISILGGEKMIYISLSIMFMLYIVIAVGFVTNTLSVSVDLNVFLHSVFHWTTTILSLLAFTIIYIAGFRYFFIELNNSLKEKAKISKALQVQNNELIEAKKKAELNESRLNEAQRVAKIGNWELDVINNKLFWSDEIYRIFGCQPQEFNATYEAFLNFIHPDDRDYVSEAYEKHITNRQPYNIIHRILLPDNEIKYVNERCESTFDKSGKAIRSIGTVADITGNIKIQKELEAAKLKAEESDRLKTEFINNMSHEIRTPMNGILGFSNLLKEELSSEKKEEYADIIQECGNQLIKIVDNILEISELNIKQGRVNEQEVCLNELFSFLLSVYKIKAKENNTPLNVKNTLSDSESIILTDENRLTKILNNIIDNAIKFTNEGYIELGCELVHDELIIYVKDTGIGIKKEMQENIFVRFSQEKQDLFSEVRGLGLGLSIARENAKLLGGEIMVESEKGKGSVFYVHLPYKPVNLNKEKGDDEDIRDRIIKMKSSYTILIAEDEEICGLYIETLIKEKLGINCVTLRAKNGREATEICKENPKLDLVLMDLRMPVMSGYEATKKIKAFRKNLPVIAQTAFSTAEDKNKAILAGCDGFISKPIKQEELFRSINEFLHINQQAQQL